MALDWHSGWLFFLLILSKLVLLALILVLVYHFRPSWLVMAWKWYRKYKASLKRHHLIITDELEISYLERKGEANGEVLLFVHGFTGEKEQFCELVYYLPQTFHVILIDLPGHGDSKPNDDKSDYRPTALVDYVHKFVTAYGFGDKKLNIIGTSMGGGIAGVYAGRYGLETLASVTVICPAGINAPQETEFIKKSRDDFRNGVKGNLLIPTSVEDMKTMLKLVVYNEIKAPSQILKVFLMLKQTKIDVYEKVMSDMASDGQPYLFDEALENVKNPLLCVWGEHDQILHVSGSDVIRQRVENSEVHVLERCGHAILLDRPRKLAKIMTQFLERVHGTS